jgi:hypothetical protein
MRRLTPHLLGYALVLTTVMLLLPRDSSLGTDDGAYGAQVYALQHGDWVLDRPLAVVDRRHEGWFNAAIVPDGPLPYTSNPAYALVLDGTATIVAHLTGRSITSGADLTVALRLVPAAGALASAATAWLLARHWRAAAAPLAFWLVAAGPMLVTSTGLWAHTLTTATAGSAALALVVLLDRPRSPGRGRTALAAAALAVALAAGAALRTESALWTMCLLATALAARPTRRELGIIATAGGLATVVWTANRAWGLSLRSDRLPIATRSDLLLDDPGWLAGRVPAAWELLMAAIVPGPGPMLAVATLAATAVAAVHLRRHPSGSRPDPVVVALVALSTLLFGTVVLVAPGQLVAGTLVAWPLVFLLLVAGRHPSWTDSRPPTSSSPAPDQPGGTGPAPGSARSATAVLLGSTGAFTLAVLATQYSNSGGLQWGGRYLSMAYVPIAVAAAVTGLEVFRKHRAALLLLLVAPTGCGMAASLHLHRDNHIVVAAATERPADAVITDHLALTRIAWPALPTAFYRSGPDRLDLLLGDLAQAGVTTVNIHGLTEVDVDGRAGYQLIGGNDEFDVRWLQLPASTASSPTLSATP